MRFEKDPAVYILASGHNGTLYIGVTSDIYGRMSEHKQGLVRGFTKRYGVTMLVYYEMHETMDSAIKREKQLKEWQRAWKIRLIEGMNPAWLDLFDAQHHALLDAPMDIERRRS
jgi:putative endonuclease